MTTFTKAIPQIFRRRVLITETVQVDGQTLSESFLS